MDVGREARSREVGEFGAVQAIVRGITALAGRPAALLTSAALGAGIFVVAFAPQQALDAFFEEAALEPAWVLLLESGVGAASFMLVTLLWLGLFRLSLLALRDQPIVARDAFPLAAVVSGGAVSLVTGVLMQAGLLLLIVPGLLVAVTTALAQHFVLDKNLGPVAALQASWTATRGRWLAVGAVLVIPAAPLLAGAVHITLAWREGNHPSLVVIGVVGAVAVPSMAAALSAAYEDLWPHARPSA
ncbi:MAG: hypothetical protein KF878_02430 [Planctomycetes bacterium]|nr:hypothetical protein [Planctomycetota bacterium]